MLLTGRHFPFLQHSWNKERPGWLLYCCSWSLLIALFTIQRFLEVAIKGWPKWDFNTHDHSIPFRRSNRLSYKAMISTRTQSQLCTATPVSSFVQCRISFWLLPSSVATFFNSKFMHITNIYIYNVLFFVFVVYCVTDKKFFIPVKNCMSLILRKLTHFLSLFSFYIPWKHKNNQKFPSAFREYRKRPISRNWGWVA